MHTIRQSTADTVRITVDGSSPPDGDSTYEVVSPGGTVIQSGTATLPTLGTSGAVFVAEYNPATMLMTVDSGGGPLVDISGIRPGDQLILGQSATGWHTVTVSAKVVGGLYLAQPPQATPADGDRVYPAYYDVPVSAIANRGRNYRINLTGTRIDGSDISRRVIFDCVSSPWEPVVSGEDVRTLLAALAPAATQSIPREQYDIWARAADREVHQTVRKQAGYADLVYASSVDFEAAGRMALRAVLVDAGYYAGDDPLAAMESARKGMRAEVYSVIESLVAVDADDDGAVSDDVSPHPFAIRFVR